MNTQSRTLTVRNSPRSHCNFGGMEGRNMKRLIIVIGLVALLSAVVITPAAAAPLKSEPVYYRVQWGDVLWRIAAVVRR